MWRGRIGISRRSDGPDLFTRPNLLLFGQTRPVVIEMRVIIEPATIGRPDIDGVATELAQEQLLYRAWSRGDHRGAARGQNIDRIMRPALGA